MDELIKKYAGRLEEIYKRRIAGDYTFDGVLSEFLEQIVENDAAMEALNRRYERKICVVCKKRIDMENEPYVFHARLNVNFHFHCPWTDVMGEDVTTHTMAFHNWNKMGEDKTPAWTKNPENCSKVLQAQGKTYPRTCPVHGIWGCK